MDRTSATNYATVSGKRQFQDANVGIGQPGTELIAADQTAHQEELMGLIESAGLTGNTGNLKQAVAGVMIMAAASLTAAITSSAALTAAQAGYVPVNASGGNVVLTLPLANSAGGTRILFEIERLDTTGNTVTVALPGGDAITPWYGMGTQQALLDPLERVFLASDGNVNWRVIRPTPSLPVVLAPGTTSVPVPAGRKRARGRWWAGGGGGGGTTGAGSAGSGGGGGEYRELDTPVTAGDALSCVAGAAGAGGAAGGANTGTAGGNSTVTQTSTSTLLLECVGGGAGVGANGAAQGSVGAGGTGGSGGYFVVPGCQGGGATAFGSGLMGGGAGGGSFGTQGAPPPIATGMLAGNTYAAPGAGGAGGIVGGAGGNGGPGEGVVWFE